MNKSVKILLWSVMSVIMIGIIVAVSMAAHHVGRSNKICNDVKIEIVNADSTMLLTVADVQEYMTMRKIKVKGICENKIDLIKIEETLELMPLIDDANCYFDNRQNLRIDIMGKRPLFHVKTIISDYCIDQDGHQMITPLKEWKDEVLVEGDVALAYAESGLYDVIKYISKSKQFRDEFRHYRVGCGNQISMWSRSHGYWVTLGTNERYEQRLDKLSRFWESEQGKLEFRGIDLQFRGQVVCKK